MACLSYEGLSGAVRRACKETNGDILANRVLGPDVSDHERADFHDAVSRSLRLGNFLLLGVGDGIRAGLQQIATLLQDRATLGFSCICTSGQLWSLLRTASAAASDGSRDPKRSPTAQDSV